MLRVNGNGVRVIGGTYEGNKSAGQSGDVYDFAAIGLANCNYSSVEGITAKDLYGIGIKLYNTNYCEIFNNTILESRIHGIYNEPATGNTEVGLKIYDNYIEVDDDDISTAIYVSSAYATNTWTKDYLIDNNHILGSLTAKQESNAVMITARGKKGTVSNNTIVGGRMGISNDYNEDGINTNNTIRDFTQYGIELVGHTNGTVRNSLVSGNNIKTTNKNGVYGIIASGASIDNIKITNNIVEGGDRNIFVQNDDAGICVGLIISGNTLINASSNIYLTNSENFSITNNTIRNNSTDNYGLFFDFSQKGIIDNNVFVGDFSGIAGFYNNDSSTVNDITISNNDITTAPITTLVGNARFGTNINIINNN
jgi:parallel beta-helix repeat protein